MQIRSRLQALVVELRHSQTRLLPLDIAERIQHTIVWAEELLMAPTIESGDAEALIARANLLLQECESLLSKQ